MGMTKQQTIDYAVEVVDELNRIIQGLELNGEVCLPKWHKNAMKKPFLAGATALIFGATREQLEAAYDEIESDKGDKETVEEMFKLIGNRAPNPDNEKPIKTVWVGYV